MKHYHAVSTEKRKADEVNSIESHYPSRDCLNFLQAAWKHAG